MTAMRLHRYPSPSGGIALGKMGVGATMLGSILPAGARWVEYLESTGTQWIDTGVVPTVSSLMVADARFHNTTLNQMSGVWGANGRFQFGIVSGKFSIGLGTVGFNAGVADTNTHRFTIDAKNNTIKIDDISQSSSSLAKSFGPYAISIFSQRYGSNTPIAFCYAELYSYKLWQNGVLVLDLRPIAIGTTGYMLDLVSGEYLPYGNKGTGGFVLGPDINAPAI